MAIYARKRRADVLREALWRLQQQTPVTATSPGSIARAFTEAMSEQIGDAYDALEFNLAQSVISTASGRALDSLGELYQTRRRTLSDLASVDSSIGAFYFYLDSAIGDDVTIPAGTRVYTGIDSFIGRQLSYSTVDSVTILAGRTRVFATIRPDFADAVYSAAANTLTVHNFTSPIGAIVKCSNPKPIAPQPGFETDENYRVRIIKSIRVTASGTADAIRFAGLNVNGVRDIKYRQAPYGMGTFEVLIIPEDPSLSAAVYNNAIAAMNIVRPGGIRMVTKQPKLTLLDFSASIVLGNVFVDDNITDQVNVAVMRYLNSLLPGDVLVYNKLVQAVMDTSNAIRDLRVTRYAPKGAETVRRNYTPAEDEQIVPGRIEITIASV